MSLEAIKDTIYRQRLADDLIEAPGFCRYAAWKMRKIAEITDPSVETHYLVYPDLTEGENVHYSLLAEQDGIKMIFNPNPAPGFPQYIGELSKAPSLIQHMKQSDLIL